MPRPGDYFLVVSGLVHAVGRYGCGAAVLIGANPRDSLVLDVNSLSIHLPQIYRKDEVTPLSDVRITDHGLCPRCRGWGLTSMFDHATPDEIIDGKHGEICSSCGGSGRTGIRVRVERSEGQTHGHIDMDVALVKPVCEQCAMAYVQPE